MPNTLQVSISEPKPILKVKREARNKEDPGKSKEFTISIECSLYKFEKNLICHHLGLPLQRLIKVI
jgi:hypothetical protein